MHKSVLTTSLMSFVLAGCTGAIDGPDKFTSDPDDPTPTSEPFPGDGDSDDDGPAPTPLRGADDVAIDMRAGDGLGPSSVDRRQLEDPGASYLRVHVVELELMDGDELVILDPDGVEVDGYAAGDPVRWSRSVDADRLTIELRTGPAVGARGYAIDTYARGVATVDDEPSTGGTYSVCGRSDFRDAACFASDAGVSRSAAAVGAMRFGGACTGSLISSQGHFITNNHCISSQSQADRLEVRFDYQRTSCGGSTTARYRSVVGARMLKTSSRLDYTLLLLDENPSDEFGFLTLDPGSPAAGTGIYIPQHPGGRLKQVAATDSQLGGPCAITRGRSARGINVGYTCDTEPGSSGSPVISSATHRMVALHHLGGCANQGTDMNLIYPEIADLLPGGGPSEPPEPPSTGTPRSGSASATIGPDDSRAYYIANVLPGSSFTVTTRPGSGAPANADIDLFIGFDAAPTRSDFDLVDGNGSASETVRGTVPASADTIHILVDGYAGTVPFTVSAEWVER